MSTPPVRLIARWITATVAVVGISSLSPWAHSAKPVTSDTTTTTAPMSGKKWK